MTTLLLTRPHALPATASPTNPAAAAESMRRAATITDDPDLERIAEHIGHTPHPAMTERTQ